MNCIKIDKRGMSQAAWLKARKMGGSDAASAAGYNNWKCGMRTFFEKTGRIEPQPETEKMYWGKVLEPVVAKEFTIRTGKKLRRCNFILQHPDPELHFMMADIDREVVGESDAIYEGKSTGPYTGFFREPGIPSYIDFQIQHYMAVTGAQRCYLAALIGGNEFNFEEIPRDEEFIQSLIVIEKAFWNCVETDTYPGWDGSEDAAEVLNWLYPKSEYQVIALPHNAFHLVNTYQAANAAKKQFETEEREAKNELKALLGDAEQGKAGPWLVKWKTSADGRRLFSVKPIKKESEAKENEQRTD